ncbi:hypothetical protein BC937DRAFT_95600 [Endogone sp. FLAS-F59071]|nr:hypothetical protein BC937DRAFT_95600 [Endogone sp. FLAS-F59071]|eukprot:RUS20254.1 hypothetical protein BC937DRAFT_95600 [Endogone sp. FLAS-F59071]
MAQYLPTTQFNLFGWRCSFNPGPFNVKEHVMIAIAASTGGTSAYATDILAIQDLFYGQRIGPLGGILLLISSQCIGYALAGICRKLLVRPAAMIWPSNLVSVSLYNTLHGDENTTRKRFRFFMIAFVAMFVWEFFPTMIAPILQSLAVLCWIGPNNGLLNKLGAAAGGLGMLDFSFDWNAISTTGPFYTPFWAQMNYYVGMLFQVWILIPILYFTNVWNAQVFPIASTKSYDQFGNIYNQSRVINPVTGALDEAAYEAYSPVSLSVSFATAYFFSLVAYAATITHVALFYGPDIWKRFMASRAEEDEDIHTKLMRRYPEVPDWWYGAIFILMLAISIALCYYLPIHLPWWALLIAVLLAVTMILPIGVITAISNNQVGLNVVTELVCGYMLPGRPLANVTFKTYGYMSMYQGLLFVSDLKLGHYMKIPPKTMFLVQVYGTIIGCIFNYYVMVMIINAKRPFLDGTETDPAGQWTGQSAEIFNTASIIWGLIGPARMFGPGSQYSSIMWGFLVGFVAPVPIYLLHRRWPTVGFEMANVSIFALGASTFPGPYGNIIISGLIASVISMWYLFRYHHSWWSKYNYVMSAAFDSATQIQTMVLFFALQQFGANFPTWWGNDQVSFEKCYAPIN